jgi:hypothetical protein
MRWHGALIAKEDVRFAPVDLRAKSSLASS